jgi:integrase
MRSTEYKLRQNSGGYWEVHWYDGTRNYRKSTRTRDIAKAEQVAVGYMQQINAGGKPELLTVGDMLAQYAQEHLKKTAVSTRDLSAIPKLKAYFSGVTVADVSHKAKFRGLVLDYREHRELLDGVSSSTVRRELVTLSSALNHAVRWGRLAVSPEIDLPPQSEPRQEYLTPKESHAFMQAAGSTMSESDPYYRFLVLAYRTGARKRAIVELQWSQVDFDAGLVEFQSPLRPKSKKRNPTVPMSKTLFAELKRWSADSDGPYVCGGNSCSWFSGRDWPKRMERIAEAAGVPKLATVHPHMLRHTFATSLLHKGATLWQVAGLLGDRPETVAATYGHHSHDNMREALEL